MLPSHPRLSAIFCPQLWVPWLRQPLVELNRTVNIFRLCIRERNPIQAKTLADLLLSTISPTLIRLPVPHSHRCPSLFQEMAYFVSDIILTKVFHHFFFLFFSIMWRVIFRMFQKSLDTDPRPECCFSVLSVNIYEIWHKIPILFCLNGILTLPLLLLIDGGSSRIYDVRVKPSLVYESAVKDGR